MVDSKQDEKVCKPEKTFCVKCKQYQEFNDGYWLCRNLFGRNRFECDFFESKDEWINVTDQLPKIGQRIKTSGDNTSFSGTVTTIKRIETVDDYYVYVNLDSIEACSVLVEKWKPISKEYKQFVARPGRKNVTLSHNEYEYCCPSLTDSWECEVDMVGLVEWLNKCLRETNEQ